MRALPSLAALTTAGRLAVNGDRDGYFYLHDVATGKVLFQTRLPAPLLGFPIAYAVDGRQFITATTGGGANGGNAIFVFALPRDAR
jgi:glucose dehydrogenase